ncbi:DUF3892 domain-containing protein [Leucobacter sp. 1207-22]|uniref:DUF3892 domain-containing protein n=1 Tax=Leucobacter sp. 1207-22 TaxID=2604456 RepID=UPI0040644B87
MSIQIYAVRFGGFPKKEETIVAYRWRDSMGRTGDWDKPTMIAWLQRGNKAYVGVGSSQVAVQVVGTGSAKYVRTVPDRTSSNNLLSLQTF